MSAYSTILKNESARNRLVLFHHAGGSSVQYRALLKHMPSEWEVLAIDLPGRGVHSKMNLSSDWGFIKDFLLSELHEVCDRPTFLLGHSMGSLLAFESAHYLEARNHQNPIVLGVSGFGCPLEDGVKVNFPFDTSSDEEILIYLKRAGGLPAELIKSEDLLNYYLKIIRSDLNLIAAYKGLKGRELKNTSLLGFHAVADSLVNSSQIQKWASVTVKNFSLKFFEGHHFHLFDNSEKFVNGVMGSWGSVQ